MLNALPRNAALDCVLSVADTLPAVPLVRKEAAEIIVLNTCRLDKSRTLAHNDFAFIGKESHQATRALLCT